MNTKLQENIALLTRFHEEGWNGGDMNAVRELVSPKFLSHNLPPETPLGPEAAIGFMTTIRAAFPDMYSTNQVPTMSYIDESTGIEYAMGHWKITATHTGDFFGMPATGKKVVFSGMDVFKIETDENGRKWLAETWGVNDIFSVTASQYKN